MILVNFGRKIILTGTLRKIGNFGRFVSVGKKFSMKRIFTDTDLQSFGALTGDWNKVHFHDDRKKSLVHGALLNGLVSAALGCYLPGPGTIVVEQTMKFPNPCYVGEEVEVTVEMTSVRKIIECRFICAVDTKVVLCGIAKVLKNEKYIGN